MTRKSNNNNNKIIYLLLCECLFDFHRRTHTHMCIPKLSKSIRFSKNLVGLGQFYRFNTVPEGLKIQKAIDTCLRLLKQMEYHCMTFEKCIFLWKFIRAFIFLFFYQFMHWVVLKLQHNSVYIITAQVAFSFKVSYY